MTGMVHQTDCIVHAFSDGSEAGTRILVEDLLFGLCWGHHGIILVNLSCLSHVCSHNNNKKTQPLHVLEGMSNLWGAYADMFRKG